MKFYTFPLSPNARRVHLALEEMGVSYEPIVVNILQGEHKKPEFLAINPNGKVPTVVDGEFALYESNAILSWLAEKAKNKFLPRDAEGRARVMQWMFYLTAHVSPGFFRPWFHLALLPPEKRDQAAIASGQAEARACLEVMERALKERDYLAGDYSIADMSLVTAVNLHEGAQVDLKDFPKVRGWLDKIRARPAWKKTEPQG